jgi:hypothetical protein
MKSGDVKPGAEGSNMKKYEGAKNAGVSTYKMLDDGIILKFKDDKYLYLYDYIKPGKEHVEKMKILASGGKGLTTYVNQNVRGNYKDKL